ncbi:hypothetical protein AgCh_023638 [Apium graveolens]
MFKGDSNHKLGAGIEYKEWCSGGKIAGLLVKKPEKSQVSNFEVVHVKEYVKEYKMLLRSSSTTLSSFVIVPESFADGGVTVVGFLQNNTGRGVWVPRRLRHESKNSLFGEDGDRYE